MQNYSTNNLKNNYKIIIDFWFQEAKNNWWKKDKDFDELIKNRYGNLHKHATIGDLKSWREDPLGCLAEIIILDQFSRNIYRDTPLAFASDALALEVLDLALTKKFDTQIKEEYRPFLYMPLMHSESKTDHEKAEILFANYQGFYEYELKHKIIIDRFGRYPHRNKILGRESTKEEIEFLKQPNSSF